MSDNLLESLDGYAHLWNTEWHRYVVVPVAFPDGRAYHDLYTWDGIYSTLSNASVNEAVIEKMIAAGTQIVDADGWAERGRKLASLSHLWTTEQHQHVLLRDRKPNGNRTEQVYRLSGELEEVTADLLEIVVQRMEEAGVRIVDRDSLAPVLAELQEAEVQREARESRAYRRCFVSRIPRRWHRHQIEADSSGEVVRAPDPTQMTDDYLRRSWEGRIPFEHVQTRYPDLIAIMLPGDELWWYRSPSSCWNMLAGRAGYSIVRDGRSVAHVTTLLS
jgi:hypothetical protein